MNQVRYNAGFEPSELPAEEREVKLSPPKRNPSRLNSRDGSVQRETSCPSSVQPVQTLPPIFQAMTITTHDDQNPPPPPPKEGPTTPISRKASRWQPPTSWDIPSSKKELVVSSPTNSSPDASPDKIDHQRSDADMMTHFQRFVRRMEGAGPRIILERLKEEWDEPTDRAMSDELQLEKHLWALTALQMRALDRFARPSQSSAPSGPLPPIALNRRRKILELDGSIGEFDIDSVIIHFLTARQARSTNFQLFTQTPKLHTSQSIPKPAAYLYPHKQLDMPSPSEVQRTA
jgi:hypothetical protein